jgi:pilus assembly protein CpaB
MNVKKIAPLIVALVLGAVAAKMIWDFIQKRPNGVAQELKHPQVVVAKRAIEAGAVLTMEDLTLGDIATETIPDTVFTAPDQLVGRVTVVAVIQGQAVSTTLLAPRGMGPGLQAAVPIGMRAVTMEINEMTGVAGYLVPGCHVDVVQTLKDEKTGLPVARTIAQNVKITAVGVRHGPDSTDGGGRSITLLVNPHDAELLELAASIGRPRFSLRGGNDLASVDTKGITFAELIGHHTDRRDEYAAATVIPSTQPAPTVLPAIAIANPTTQPTAMEQDTEWTVEVIHGGTATESKFALHNANEQYSDTGNN